jgi:RecJ-like exonuclease
MAKQAGVKYGRCPACGGSGKHRGANDNCPMCDGKGKVPVVVPITTPRVGSQPPAQETEDTYYQ